LVLVVWGGLPSVGIVGVRNVVRALEREVGLAPKVA